LYFTHRLFRIDINLVKGESYEGELSEDAVVKIHGTIPVALVDLSNGDVVRDTEAVVAPITAHRNAFGSYSAIVVPQKLLAQVPLVEVIMKDVSYLVSSKFIFEAGVRHTVDVVIANNPDKVVINVGGGIDEWN
ncbi:MAG: fimbrillin family protein, partial [Candidatus Cryptobacteroides sp.]